ncbi:MAG: PHP domain-containing protein [Proteobacteria bacterium]|nr:PHP domain-containing protein [Pseudomonadota bacterium]MBU1688621.1 PHP domain-containing protein [Pseudomonadota bacterium]
MRTVDLHTHSSYSDGTFGPTELVSEAVRVGLAAISLTDHDTLAGVEEAQAAGHLMNIEVMSGIEISASHEGNSVHILGYGVPGHDPDLNGLIRDLQEIRTTRNQKILARLAEQRIIISDDDLQAISRGLIGRPHIAQLLIRKGIVKTFDQAFDRYLKKNGKAWVQTVRFPASEAIRIVKNAGGLPVLAHPGAVVNKASSIRKTIEQLTSHGLAGIEAIYPGHSTTLNRQLIEIAGEFHLLVTGGSDFHGNMKQIRLGGRPVMPQVPYTLFQKLKDRLAEKSPDHAPSSLQTLPNTQV